jgi:hypothetical protein
MAVPCDCPVVPWLHARLAWLGLHVGQPLGSCVPAWVSCSGATLCFPPFPVFVSHGRRNGGGQRRRNGGGQRRRKVMRCGVEHSESTITESSHLSQRNRNSVQRVDGFRVAGICASDASHLTWTRIFRDTSKRFLVSCRVTAFHLKPQFCFVPLREAEQCHSINYAMSRSEQLWTCWRV